MLLAFTAAQIAVIRLRAREPDLARPFRARPEVRIRGVAVPLPALIGAPLTLACLGAGDRDARGRPLGRAWPGSPSASSSTSRSRWWNERGVLEHVDPIAALPPGASFRRLLVPMKLGDIGEEMVATAIALAKERGAEVEAVFVVRVPREYPLEGGAAGRVRRAARRGSLAEARALGEDNGVEVQADDGARALDRARDRRRGDAVAAPT